ncbi:MAG TPA: hypothetical protein VFR85_17670 [Anaeromyxobacteraceae bacterium]|nr:hypothetical protein [Anaeromyxobacteraceae bacterium]
MGQAVATCREEGCCRPVFSRDLCGFHALQGYYRAEAVRGVGLVATRRPRRPHVVVLAPEDAAERQR